MVTGDSRCLLGRSQIQIGVGSLKNHILFSMTFVVLVVAIGMSGSILVQTHTNRGIALRQQSEVPHKVEVISEETFENALFIANTVANSLNTGFTVQMLEHITGIDNIVGRILELNPWRDTETHTAEDFINLESYITRHIENFIFNNRAILSTRSLTSLYRLLGRSEEEIAEVELTNIEDFYLIDIVANTFSDIFLFDSRIYNKDGIYGIDRDFLAFIDGVAYVRIGDNRVELLEVNYPEPIHSIINNPKYNLRLVNHRIFTNGHIRFVYVTDTSPFLTLVGPGIWGLDREVELLQFEMTFEIANNTIKDYRQRFR